MVASRCHLELIAMNWSGVNNHHEQIADDLRIYWVSLELFSMGCACQVQDMELLNSLAPIWSALKTSLASLSVLLCSSLGFPCSSDGNEYACNAGGLSLTPGLGRARGEGNGNPLQYSCRGNPMDRGAWQAAVHGVTKSQTWLSN